MLNIIHLSWFYALLIKMMNRKNIPMITAPATAASRSFWLTAAGPAPLETKLGLQR